MKILVGCFYHETNTFNPNPTHLDDFVLIEGNDILDRFASTDVFKARNVEIIPSIYATGLSSGMVKKDAFTYIVDKMISTIQHARDIDGIWMHLHGSMIVEEIGSGELSLVKEIRKHVGDAIPISLTLDIHANIPAELSKHVNIVKAYRTVPHIDQHEIERDTAEMLMDYIYTHSTATPIFTTLPFIVCGEKALGKREPLRSIFEKLDEMEKQEGISCVSFFLGHAWVDSVNTGASIVVIPETEEYQERAREMSNQFAHYIHAKQNDFTYDAMALEPMEAIDAALNDSVKPIFISDSGDNTTAGAPGYNTILLQLLIDHKNLNRKVLIASIFDKAAYRILANHEVGDHVSVNIGTNQDENSQPVPIDGIVKSKGDLLGALNATDEKVGGVCTVSVGNHLDVVIADKGDSFTTMNHFSRANVDINEYDVIVLKQGYLFDELSQISKLDILALTPGASYLEINELEYTNIQKDKHFI